MLSPSLQQKPDGLMVEASRPSGITKSHVGGSVKADGSASSRRCSQCAPLPCGLLRGAPDYSVWDAGLSRVTWVLKERVTPECSDSPTAMEARVERA